MTKALACQEQAQKTKFVKINGVLIESRSNDAYVNATALCKAGSRRWNEFFRRKETRELFEKVSLEARIVVSKLIEAKRGKNSQTWVHPDIAIDLAQWISVDFKYAVIQLVRSEINGHLLSPNIEVNSLQWEKTRGDGKQSRKTFAQTAVSYNKTGGQIASMTNQIYKGVFDLDRKSVSKAIGLSEKENLRDKLTAPSLHCISFGEEVATNTLHETFKNKGYASCSESGKRGHDASSKMRAVYEEFMGNTMLCIEVKRRAISS